MTSSCTTNLCSLSFAEIVITIQDNEWGWSRLNNGGYPHLANFHPDNTWNKIIKYWFNKSWNKLFIKYFNLSLSYKVTYIVLFLIYVLDIENFLKTKCNLFLLIISKLQITIVMTRSTISTTTTTTQQQHYRFSINFPKNFVSIFLQPVSHKFSRVFFYSQHVKAISSQSSEHKAIKNGEKKIEEVRWGFGNRCKWFRLDNILVSRTNERTTNAKYFVHFYSTLKVKKMQ